MSSGLRKSAKTITIVALLVVWYAFPLFLYDWSSSSDDSQTSRILIEEDFTIILRPNAAGYSSAWTPSPAVANYLNVDETTAGGDGDTSYNYADTNGEIDAYGVTDITDARGDDTIIDGVTVWAWAKRMSVGSCTFQVGVRIGTTNYFTMVAAAPTASYVNYTHTYTNSPATSLPWTCAELNGTSIILTAPDASPNVAVTQCAMLVPGTQLLWPPTFTSTPDTSVLAGAHYSYVATVNETSTFELYDAYYSSSLGPFTSQFILRPTAVSGSPTNMADYPATSVYYDKLDETTAGGDSDTTHVSSSASLQSSLYLDYPTITWADYDTISDIDVGAWAFSRAALGSNGASQEGLYVSSTTYPFHSGTHGDAYENFTGQWEANPYTAAEWTTGQVDSIITFVADPDTSITMYWTQTAVRVNITYTLDAPADWFTFTPANATLWGNPGYEDLGNWYISIRAESTPGDWSAWQNFTITVGEPWGPTFTSSPDTDAYIDIPYSYEPTLNESSTLDATITEPTEPATSGSLTDTWAYYRYKDSLTEAYITGPAVWSYDRLIFFKLDATDIPVGADLTNITIDIWCSYDTAAGPMCVNVSGAFAITNSSYTAAPVWDETILKSLTPAGSLSFSPAMPGNAVGWRAFDGTGYADDWQDQFDTNRTLYIALTGWSIEAEASYGFNVSTAKFSIDYVVPESPSGSGWLTWNSGTDTLEGTPLAEDDGLVWTVSIAATSAAGLDTSWQNFTITVGSEPDLIAPVAIAQWGLSTDGVSIDTFVNFSSISTGWSIFFTSNYSSDEVGITNVLFNLTESPLGTGSIDVDYFHTAVGGAVALPTGYYGWNMTVFDAAGNIGWDTFSFTITQGMVLRPDGETDLGSWTDANGLEYAEVADPLPYYQTAAPVHDGDDTYYSASSDAEALVLSLDDFAGNSGSEYNVTLYVWAKGSTATDVLILAIYDGANEWGPGYAPIPTVGYANYTYTWDECPWTSSEWTTTTINQTQLYFILYAPEGTVSITMCGVVITEVTHDVIDPVANAGPDQSVDANTTVNFDGSLSTDNIAVVNWTWSFTYDGSATYMYDETPSYYFVTPGVYVVTLIVYDEADNSDTDTMTLTIGVPEPSAPTPMEWITSSGVMTILGVIGFIGFIVFPVAYVKFGDKGKGAMNGFVAFIIIEMVLFGLFFASLLSG